jgi:hypothetical protein
MTKDEIIKLATEAGLCYPSNGFVDWIDAGPSLPELTFFVSLVAEQEREQCARVCEETSSDMNPMAHWAANECARLIRSRDNQ